MIKCNYNIGDTLRCKTTLLEYKLNALGETLAIVELESKGGLFLETVMPISMVNDLETYKKESAKIYFQYRTLWTGHNNPDTNYYVTDDDLLTTLSRTPYLKNIIHDTSNYKGVWIHENALIIGRTPVIAYTGALDYDLSFALRERDIEFIVAGYFYIDPSEENLDQHFDASPYFPSIKTMSSEGYNVKLLYQMTDNELLHAKRNDSGCIIFK